MRRMLERALGSLTAASIWAARKARLLRTRVREMARRGRTAGSGPGTAPRPEDAAFLNEVSETLRRIETSGDPAAAPPHRAPPLMARLRAAAGWLRRLREPIRRHEDVLLAAALLLGILAMVIHWRLSGSANVPLRGPRVDAPSMRAAHPVDGDPPRPPEVRADGVGAVGTGDRVDLPR